MLSLERRRLPKWLSRSCWLKAQCHSSGSELLLSAFVWVQSASAGKAHGLYSERGTATPGLTLCSSKLSPTLLIFHIQCALSVRSSLVLFTFSWQIIVHFDYINRRIHLTPWIWEKGEAKWRESYSVSTDSENSLIHHSRWEGYQVCTPLQEVKTAAQREKPIGFGDYACQTCLHIFPLK